jgi:hypothetical protein
LTTAIPEEVKKEIKSIQEVVWTLEPKQHGSLDK